MSSGLRSGSATLRWFQTSGFSQPEWGPDPRSCCCWRGRRWFLCRHPGGHLFSVRNPYCPILYRKSRSKEKNISFKKISAKYFCWNMLRTKTYFTIQDTIQFVVKDDGCFWRPWSQSSSHNHFFRRKDIYPYLIERLINWITEMFRRFFFICDWSDFKMITFKLG